VIGIERESPAKRAAGSFDNKIGVEQNERRSSRKDERHAKAARCVGGQGRKEFHGRSLVGRSLAKRKTSPA